MKTARVIRIISNQFQVLTEEGVRMEAVLRKKARRLYPVVGDVVEIEEGEHAVTIENVKERKNCLTRPSIANVDEALIVMSVKEPDFSYTLVDRLIFLISYEGITPVILLTKTDLAEKEETETIRKEYEHAGYRVLTSNASKEEIGEVLKGKITVLCGQSGVGKSTYLNALDPTFELPTQPISYALGRGKHTTRHTELYEVLGGWIADTPGFSSLEFAAISSKKLAKCVPDFQIGEPCRFEDCRHLKEPGCRVREKAENGEISKIRYQNYLEVISLCDQIKEWEK